jgi:diguanylate cyclase (GGDEF)-like protein
VLFLDLDGLKQVNDELGHEIGSSLLKETAALLNSCFRESDVTARIGGDEFVVAGIASEAGIAMASRRLLQAALDRNEQPNHQYALEFSVGTATLDGNNPESLEAIVKRADQAMYQAKRAKKQSRS